MGNSKTTFWDSLTNFSQRTSPYKQQILARQLSILYRNLEVAVPASFICATIVYIFLQYIPHTNIVTYWYIAISLTSIFRLSLIPYYKNRQPKFSVFLYSTLINALLWGFAGSVLIPPGENTVEQIIIIIICAGLTSGGIQTLQMSLIASFWYVFLIIVPLITWAFVQMDLVYYLLGCALIIYLLTMIMISFIGNRQILKLMRLQYENEELIKNLFESNKQLKVINFKLQEKENSLNLIQDNAPIGMAIVALDGHWLQVNNVLCKLIGYSKEELKQMTFQDITYLDDLKNDLGLFNQLLQGEIPSYQLEKRYIHKNGQMIWVLLSVSLVRDKENQPQYLIYQIQDISDRKRSELRISEFNKMNEMLQICYQSKEAYPIIKHAAKLFFPDLGGVITILNYKTDTLEIVESWGEEEFVSDQFKPTDCWSLRIGNIYIVDDPSKELICPHFFRNPKGASVCLPLIVRNEVIGVLIFYSYSQFFIAETQLQLMMSFSESLKLSLANIKLQEALKEQAIHDPLTGLHNRRYLNEVLGRELMRANREKTQICVIILDIDYFKEINDTFGHEAGDEVLKSLGELLKNVFRDPDITCRYGGEEFVIVLPNTDEEAAKKRIEDIREKFRNLIITSKEKRIPPITLSAGVAQNKEFNENVDYLLNKADKALYTAKNEGRDKVILSS